MTTRSTEVFPDPEDSIEPEPVEEPEVDNSASGMRERLKDQAARIQALEAEKAEQSGEFRARTMSQAFEAINLNPTEGIGKAVAVTFEGEPEQLAEFAEAEFGYVPVREHPYAKAIAAGQQALDLIGHTAGSVAPPTQQDELSKAEANRDNATTLAIKGAQLERLIRP